MLAAMCAADSDVHIWEWNKFSKKATVAALCWFSVFSAPLASLFKEIGSLKLRFSIFLEGTLTFCDSTKKKNNKKKTQATEIKLVKLSWKWSVTHKTPKDESWYPNEFAREKKTLHVLVLWGVWVDKKWVVLLPLGELSVLVIIFSFSPLHFPLSPSEKLLAKISHWEKTKSLFLPIIICYAQSGTLFIVENVTSPSESLVCKT